MVFFSRCHRTFLHCHSFDQNLVCLLHSFATSLCDSMLTALNNKSVHSVIVEPTRCHFFFLFQQICDLVTPNTCWTRPGCSINIHHWNWIERRPFSEAKFSSKSSSPEMQRKSLNVVSTRPSKCYSSADVWNWPLYGFVVALCKYKGTYI